MTEKSTYRPTDSSRSLHDEQDYHTSSLRKSNGILEAFQKNRTKEKASHTIETNNTAEWREGVQADELEAPLVTRPLSISCGFGNASGTHIDPGSKKRQQAEDPFIQSSNRSAPKRPKTNPKLPKLKDLQSLKGSIVEESPTSPLFFSNTPRLRPALPRFSSSDAGAAMMKQVHADETTASALSRRMKMSRNSISSTSPLSAISPRSSTSRTQATGDMNTMAKGLAALSQVGILDLLEQDDRLIFIIDLGNRLNFLPGPLSILFINTTLRGMTSICDGIKGRTSEDLRAIIGDAGFLEFKAWATNFVEDEQAMDVVLPTYQFGGAAWTCLSLKKRFRIFYGTMKLPSGRIISRGHRQQTYATASPDSRRGGAEIDQAEVTDYFGSAGMAYNPSPSSQVTPDGLIKSIESPAGVIKQTSSHSVSSSKQIVAIPSIDTPVSHSTTLQPPLSSQNLREFEVASESQYPVDSLMEEQGFLDWTRLAITPTLPKHVRFARSVDWASTSLGPIDKWSGVLRSVSNLLMVSPHPTALYWGDDNVAIYNESYILLAGQKHPKLMGQSYREAWGEIWNDVKDSFLAAKLTGQSAMKDDDLLFVNRHGFLEETYFSWSLIPMIDEDGRVAGLFNPAFEKTRRKIAERRMLTLREVGETTAVAREVKSFWRQVLKGLDINEYDVPFALLYSVGDDTDSESASMHSSSTVAIKTCVLEGTLPEIPEGHPIAPTIIDLRSGTDGFAAAFQEAAHMNTPVLLETATGTLNAQLLDGFTCRGFEEKPRAAIVCPIHPTTGDNVIGFLVMGINPRRPYDDDYSLFIQLLSRQLATSMASVVLFEEEIRRGQRAAKLAALDRIELSEQLAIRTQEAVESENKFTRMAELAPVGMFIADCLGNMMFTNETFHKISGYTSASFQENWMECIVLEDRPAVEQMWQKLIENVQAMSAEFRFRTPWEDPNGARSETWVLASAYPEQDDDGSLKTVFGSITNISQQKWAQDFQKKRTEEAVELKRQQSNFMDMTSHEMRNPLSAILQCADEITSSLHDFKMNSGDNNILIALLDSNIDAAQTITLCANHQTRIVSDVLTLSKLDSALLLVTPVDVRPASIVQQALKMFGGELQTADIKMQFKIDPSLARLEIEWVRLDPLRLLQVLINLTTNAIKFTSSRAKRTITIDLSASFDPPSESGSSLVSYIPTRLKRDDVTTGKDWGIGDNVYLNFAVRDTGKGLTEAERKLLFLRFSQASPKTHVQYGGSGLGLFISRELVELQGGEIGVSSESGIGSTFAFYIKARKSHGPPDGTEEMRQSLTPGNSRKSSINRKSRSSDAVDGANTSNISKLSSIIPKPLAHLKVLIVEDNIVNQKVLSKALRNQGYGVKVANHGGECLDHLRKTKFWKGNQRDGEDLHIVLMDLEMPVMDGLTCTRTIRELQSRGDIIQHIPIIAV